LEFPNNESIQNVANQLRDLPFLLVVKTTKPVDASRFFRVYLRPEDDDNYYDFATWRTEWEIGPDGKTYMCRWSPSDYHIILVLGKYEQLTELIRQQTGDLSNRHYALTTKTRLGEIDEKAAHDELKSSINKAREALAKRILAL
jgi:hypothetical protein